jgi:hypothetical protein
MRRALAALALTAACVPELRSLDGTPETRAEETSSPDASAPSTTYLYTPGTAYCDGSWAQLETDRAHCGACGVVCIAPQATCVLGECRCPGDRGLECDGRCVDLARDPEHCGACGRPCGRGGRCVDGACAM